MNINYTRLAELLLPTFLRQPRMLALLRTMLQPMQQLHNRHRTQRMERLYSLAHTGQVCHIKDVLNRYFGVGNHATTPDYNAGFQIQDIDALGQWIWAYDEQTDQADRNTMLQDETAQPDTMLYDEYVILYITCAFVLIVPENIDLDTCRNQIERLLNQYRLASRTAYINQ